ncbi:MAG: fimbrillin family protein [Bacteroidales bacterium]|nr:fimbrillin family protein [Bacteroidales bacterium]
MKKKLFFAALACTTLAGCSQEEVVGGVDEQNEIALEVVSKTQSRGYVTGNSLWQIPYPSQQQEIQQQRLSAFVGYAYNSPRDIFVSAFNATDQTDYFIGKTFKYQDDGGVPVKGGPVENVSLGKEASPIYSSYWRAETPIYWPLGKQLDFLAYSQSYGCTNDKSPLIQATWKNANEVDLKVTKESKQDDILFAANKSYGYNTGSYSNYYSGISYTNRDNVPLQFRHTQAWIRLALCANQLKYDLEEGGIAPLRMISDTDYFILDGYDRKMNFDELISFTGAYEEREGSGMWIIEIPDRTLKINSIKLADVYEGGTLNLKNEDTGAKATWTFFDVEKTDVLVNDPLKVLEIPFTLKIWIRRSSVAFEGMEPTISYNWDWEYVPKYLDVLLPAQPVTDHFIVNYTLNGINTECSLSLNDRISSRAFRTISTDWQQNYRYLYRLNFNLSEMSVTPRVEEWYDEAERW